MDRRIAELHPNFQGLVIIVTLRVMGAELKTALILAAICMGTAFGQDAAQIKYTWLSMPAFTPVKGADGKHGPPEARTPFPDEVGKANAVYAEVTGGQMECPAAWSDVAYMLGKQNKKEGRIRLLAYKGCVFSITDEMKGPLKGLEPREELRIEIEWAGGNTIRLTPESNLPFMVLGTDLSIAANLPNTVWTFKQAGVSFEAGGAVYTVDKAGATIRFTQDAVQMDGVRKK
jgi:hypothetical protein